MFQSAVWIYDALKYHSPQRRISQRAQFFYVLRNWRHIWITFMRVVLLVNCIGAYLLEGRVFNTEPNLAILAYLMQFFCLMVYASDLVFQYIYSTKQSFWRRRWNIVQLVVSESCAMHFSSYCIPIRLI